MYIFFTKYIGRTILTRIPYAFGKNNHVTLWVQVLVFYKDSFSTWNLLGSTLIRYYWWCIKDMAHRYVTSSRMDFLFCAHLAKHSTEHGAFPRGSPQPLAGGGKRQEACRFTVVTSPQLFLQSGTTWSPPHTQGLSWIVWCWPAVGPFLFDFHLTFCIWP